MLAFPPEYRPLPTRPLFASLLSPSPGILSVMQTSGLGLHIEAGESQERWAGSGKTVRWEVINGSPKLTISRMDVELEGDPRP